MAIANLGSIADIVQTRVYNIPSVMSGTPLQQLAWEAVVYAQNYTGQSIGSIGIDDLYQPAIIKRTMADVLDIIQAYGPNVASIDLGDLKIQHGKGGNVDTASNKLREQADKELSAIGRTFRFKQVIGGG